MKLRRKVGQKGQVVIPKNIREKLGIKPNTEVLFTEKDDKVIIEKKNKKPLSEISRELENQITDNKEFKSSDKAYEERMKKKNEKGELQ